MRGEQNFSQENPPASEILVEGNVGGVKCWWSEMLMEGNVNVVKCWWSEILVE